MDILHLFGVASGLKTNLQKSSVLPIKCEDQELKFIQQQLPCAIADFSCKYLGLPLALKKLKKSTYNLLLIEWRIKLLRWKVDLLTRVGRKVHVQFVLTSMLIYIAMDLDFPQ
jgi:hypothetical protein